MPIACSCPRPSNPASAGRVANACASRPSYQRRWKTLDQAARGVGPGLGDRDHPVQVVLAAAPGEMIEAHQGGRGRPAARSRFAAAPPGRRRGGRRAWRRGRTGRSRRIRGSGRAPGAVRGARPGLLHGARPRTERLERRVVREQGDEPLGKAAGADLVVELPRTTGSGSRAPASATARPASAFRRAAPRAARAAG